MLPLAFGFAIAITIFALAFWFAHDPGRDSTAITKRQEETTGNVYIVLPPAQPAQEVHHTHTHTHYHAHVTVQPTGQPYDNRQRRIASVGPAALPDPQPAETTHRHLYAWLQTSDHTHFCKDFMHMSADDVIRREMSDANIIVIDVYGDGHRQLAAWQRPTRALPAPQRPALPGPGAPQPPARTFRIVGEREEWLDEW